MPSREAGADVTDAPHRVDGSFGASACSRCVTSACGAALLDCGSDPDCASYWSCVEGCGVGSDGDVDPACAAACPSGTSSSGAQAELELTHCRTDGAGALCAACGTPVVASESPLLNEHCPADAGPDASACARCIDENCCLPQAACGEDCREYIACMAEYADYQKCMTEYPGGFLPGEQIHGCITIYCPTDRECSESPGALLECILQECPVEYADLIETEEGASYWECLSTTVDAPSCLAEYPEAGAPANAMNACVQNVCDFPIEGP